jgi:hypothetical protein
MNGQSAGPHVVFLHIGRTGGTTLGRILARGLPRGSVYTVDSARVEGSLAELARMPEADLRRLRLVRGHASFGVHELLPPPVTYVTLVRDPVHRLLSHYHYVLTRPYHELHAEVTRRGLSFAGYVSSGISPELDNWQTRVLAGAVDLPIGACGPETLERAKANVEQWFAVAGPLERFDETLVMCRRALGWKLAPSFAPRNAAPGPRHRADLSPADLEAAVSRNELDLELYSWIFARFVDAIRAEDGFAEEVDELRAAKRRYAPLGRLEVRLTELARDAVRGRRRPLRASNRTKTRPDGCAG